MERTDHITKTIALVIACAAIVVTAALFGTWGAVLALVFWVSGTWYGLAAAKH